MTDFSVHYKILRSALEIRQAMPKELLDELKRHDPAPLTRRQLDEMTKNRILENDDYKCAICSRRKPQVCVSVAHIKPVEELGNNDLSNLIALCSSKREPRARAR
jgi:predicted restriction endonuclease